MQKAKLENWDGCDDTRTCANTGVILMKCCRRFKEKCIVICGGKCISEPELQYHDSCKSLRVKINIIL